MKCFLGIDVGTSGVKAVIVDEKGCVKGIGYREIELLVEKPLWAEQAPQQWWLACKAAVAEAVGASGDGKNVEGIGLTGQMLGSVVLDKNREPVGNCMLWLDQRAIEEQKFMVEKVGMDRLLDITCMMPLTGYWGPKLLWLKKNKPSEFEKMRHVIFPKDYIVYKLTGEISTEVSDASASILFDVPKRKWSRELFEICGLPYDVVPDRTIESQEVAGYLRKDIASELGLKADIPVVGGAGDQHAGAIGCGTVREGVVSASIGTSGVVYAATNTPYADRMLAGMQTHCHAIPDMWSFLGCMLSAGGSFRWLRDTLFARERDECEKNNKNIYAYLDGVASKAPVASEGLVFLPYLNGERAPYPDPYAKGGFWGLSIRHGLPEMTRSVMEGITFGLRDIVEVLKKAGVNVNQVRVSGGGAKSKFWRQMMADIFGVSVATTNVGESGCIGAAILAGVGAGHYSSVQEASDEIVGVVSEIEPNKRNAEIYEDFYGTYKELYAKLQPTGVAQSKLLEKWNDADKRCD